VVVVLSDISTEFQVSPIGFVVEVSGNIIWHIAQYACTVHHVFREISPPAELANLGVVATFLVPLIEQVHEGSLDIVIDIAVHVVPELRLDPALADELTRDALEVLEHHLRVGLIAVQFAARSHEIVVVVVVVQVQPLALDRTLRILFVRPDIDLRHFDTPLGYKQKFRVEAFRLGPTVQILVVQYPFTASGVIDPAQTMAQRRPNVGVQFCPILSDELTH